MRSILLVTVLAISACSRAPGAQAPDVEPAASVGVTPSPSPEAALAGAEAAGAAIDPLTDQVWTLTPGDGRPGVFRIFLSSGAMMQGSCVETYRVSEWRRDGAGKVVWNEDGTEISADVVSVDGSALALGLNLAGGQKVETYTAASAPFVCPDLPR